MADKGKKSKIDEMKGQLEKINSELVSRRDSVKKIRAGRKKEDLDDDEKEKIEVLRAEIRDLKIQHAELKRMVDVKKIQKAFRETKKSLENAKFDEIRRRLEENGITTENGVKTLIDSKNEKENLAKKYDIITGLLKKYGLNTISDLENFLEKTFAEKSVQ